MINLLDKFRIGVGETSNAKEFLCENDIIQIDNWYGSYSSNVNFKFEDAIDLMDFLYFYENIELYPADEYWKHVIPLSEKHCFKPDKFNDLFMDFRKMVFD
jgi:hypothetical protein